MTRTDAWQDQGLRDGVSIVPTRYPNPNRVRGWDRAWRIVVDGVTLPYTYPFFGDAHREARRH